MNERAAKQKILPPELEAVFDKLRDPVSVPKTKLRGILQDLLEQEEQICELTVENSRLRRKAAPEDKTITQPATILNIGDKAPDGTVYGGISPDTGKAMYAMPADASLTMTFNSAKKYAQGLNTRKAHGHDDWHVPTKAELNVLFNNRAAIGGFNVSGSCPAGWYWSSSSGSKWNAWVQRFSVGCQNYIFKDVHSSVRCVR
jgi:hypothetical protein